MEVDVLSGFEGVKTDKPEQARARKKISREILSKTVTDEFYVRSPPPISPLNALLQYIFSASPLCCCTYIVLLPGHNRRSRGRCHFPRIPLTSE